MKHLVLLLALLLSGTAAIGQNRAADETAVRALLTTLATTIKKQDVAALGTHYTPDYTFTSAEGKRMNKTERLAELKAAKPFDLFEYNDVAMRFYGPTTAVVTTTVRNRVVGQPIRNTLATLVMVKSGGSWLVAAAQGTNAADATVPSMAAKP